MLWKTRRPHLCLSHHQCKKKHTLVCPDFLKTGSCPRRAQCKLQHHRGPKRSASTSLSTPAKRARTKEPCKRSGQPDAIRNHLTPWKSFNVLCFPSGPTCQLWSCEALRKHQGPPRGRWNCHRSFRCPAPQRRQTLQTHHEVSVQESKVHEDSTRQALGTS